MAKNNRCLFLMLLACAFAHAKNNDLSVLVSTPVIQQQDMSYISTAFAQENCGAAMQPHQQQHAPYAHAPTPYTAYASYSSTLATVVMLYFDECDILRYQVQAWASSKPEQLQQLDFLVIDDHSSLSALHCLGNSTATRTAVSRLQLQILRVDVRLAWNIGGARNLGAFYSCSPFLLLCDIDAFFSPRTLGYVLDSLRNESFAFGQDMLLFARHLNATSTRHHPGIMLLPRELYWRAQACDEDFVGHYGVTDVHFKHRAQALGATLIYGNHFLCHIQSLSAPKSFQAYSRSPRFNHHLYHAKLKGHIAWNSTVLRFPWHAEQIPLPWHAEPHAVQQLDHSMEELDVSRGDVMLSKSWLADAKSACHANANANCIDMGCW